jgi:hypothetical protein
MLILQIALGIVVAYLILAFWPVILGGALLLVVGAILITLGVALWLKYGTLGLFFAALFGFLAWGVRTHVLNDDPPRRS